MIWKEHNIQRGSKKNISHQSASHGDIFISSPSCKIGNVNMSACNLCTEQVNVTMLNVDINMLHACQLCCRSKYLACYKIFKGI